MLVVASRVSVVLALALVAGCGQEPPPRSTLELMDDAVLLQTVLARCNQSGAAQDDVECRHAREAVLRLESTQSADEQRQKQAAAQSEFERAREERRRREELERQREEARQKVDPYTLPLVKDPMNPPEQSSTGQEPAETGTAS